MEESSGFVVTYNYVKFQISHLLIKWLWTDYLSEPQFLHL